MILKRLLVMLVSVVLFTIPALSQNKVVTGKVTDSKDGSALQNATVKVTGTNIITQTDATGAFKFRVPASAATLTISSVGYATQEVSIGEGDISVKLVATTTALNDVVVIGYGTVRKKDLTGTINKIGTKDFNQGVVTTPEQLITGKIPGVTITSNGGQPGQGSVIRIRGGASLNASNDPLIILDGVILTGGVKTDGSQGDAPGLANILATINPNDIESFTVLKDASSAAIYGSRASNGVIIITTKSGKSGKPKFNFSTQLSGSTPANYLNVLSASQFRQWVQANGNASQIAMLGTANTDWQKQIYQTGIGSNNNFSVTGAALKNKLPYRISANYNYQDGILKTDNLQRGVVGVHVTPTLIDDHLKLDVNVNTSLTRQRFANQGAIGNAWSFDPTKPVYDANNKLFRGYYEWMQGTTYNTLANINPVADLYQRNDVGHTARLFGNIQGDYKFHFLPDLHLVVNYGYDTYNGHGRWIVPDSARQNFSTHGQIDSFKTVFFNQTFETYLNYIKNITSIKLNINANAGYGYYDNKSTYYNYPQYQANGTLISGTQPTYPTNINRFTILSYWGRLILTQNNKYTLMGSIRTDGSSRFSSSNRWGVFPAAAFTWQMKNEDFLKNVNAISDLKLRLSYGETGNQDGIGLYSYIPFYTKGSANAQYQFGNSPYYTWNPSMYITTNKWETTQQYDLGLDFGFIKNRLTGSIDFYHKNTYDLLASVSLPAGSNFGNQITANIGKMKVTGLELAINATPFSSRDFGWDLSYTIAFNHREITKLTYSDNTSFTGFDVGGISGGTNNTVQNHQVGYAPNSFFLYQQIYDKTTGKPIEGAYVDKNGDGVLNTSDKYHYHSPDPTCTMGFNTSIRYKKWSLVTVLRANVGNYVYNNIASQSTWKLAILDPGGYLRNATTGIYKTGFVNAQYNSDYYVENASFIKMDNVGLNYNVGKILKGGTRMTVGVTCQNVFTITKYSGLDPEISSGIDNNPYPRPRIYTATVNIDF